MLTVSLAAATGCSPSGETTSEPPDQVEGVRLAMTLPEDIDVVGMRFELQEVDCLTGDPVPDGVQVEVEKSLEDLVFPGGIPEFEDAPFDADSAHLFADLFVVMPAGCYDIRTTPLREGGDISEDCGDASMLGVEVHEGQTTEVWLINQCEGRDPGAGDVITTLNRPPVLQNLYFVKSKFVSTCDVQKVCATALDPDGDPIEFEWSVLSALPLAGPILVETIDGEGETTECIAMIPHEPGKYDLVLKIYDLFWLEGILTRIEDHLQTTDPAAESHADITFHFYAGGAGPLPSAEVCDGEDNDCDFEVDELCVPEEASCDEPGQCFGYEECAEDGSCGSRSVCARTAEDAGVCVDGGTQCFDLPSCEGGSADCAEGSVCVVDSCCGRPVCVSPDQFCTGEGEPGDDVTSFGAGATLSM